MYIQEHSTFYIHTNGIKHKLLLGMSSLCGVVANELERCLE